MPPAETSPPADPVAAGGDAGPPPGHSPSRRRNGWRSGLARFSMALLRLEIVTGLAITLAPFQPAVQWSGRLQTVLGAVTQLQQLNPQSHRAGQQWGVIRANNATRETDPAAAEQALQRAHALNPEETGALLVLGEVALLRGDFNLADERLANATHTNPKAVGAFSCAAISPGNAVTLRPRRTFWIKLAKPSDPTRNPKVPPAKAT